MAAKKTTRRVRRRTRKPPEQEKDITDVREETSQATAVKEAPDFSPEISELPLNLQTIDDAEPQPKPPEDDKTDRELLEGKPADRYEQGQLMHKCGLPVIMCAPQSGRKILAEYLQTHDVTHQHLMGLELTDPERELHKKYRPVPAATGLVDIMYFTAALRLWKKGLPIDPKKNMDLNSMKVEE